MELPVPKQRTFRPLHHEREGLEQKPSQVVTNASRLSTQNILCIFSGRWAYLRINFAYIYRSLRKNGGVLDKVYYIMIQYDNSTLHKLIQLANSANEHLDEDVFQFWLMNPNTDTTDRPKYIFAGATYKIFNEMARHPERKYFKMDDDIVYIHPGAFRQLIEQQNTSECFIHFANIGGANWRSSYIHQEMGIYDDGVINPRKLKFGFNLAGSPKCGWRSAECAELALKAFLHHYENKSLEQFLFDGRYLTKERARYSINFYLLDVNLFDFKAMLESGPLKESDEEWLTQIYSRKVKNPNCIVGKAFVVHFAYSINRHMISKGAFLERFEVIAFQDLVRFLPEKFQTILDFGTKTETN